MKKTIARLLTIIFVIVGVFAQENKISFAASAGLPATPSIQHDNWDGDGNYKITMSIWWGNNGTTFKLYENNTIVNTQTLVDNSPNAQNVIVEFKNKPKRGYVYKCELINSFGVSTSSPITVNVTIGEEPLPKPVEKGPFDGTGFAKIDFENIDNADSNLGGATTTFAIEKNAGRNNSKCLSISSNTDAQSAWYYHLPVKIGKAYKVTAYIKGENLIGKGTINLQSEDTLGYIENSTDWQKVTFISRVKNEYNPFIFCSLGGKGVGAKGKVYFDDIEITEYPEYDDLETGLNTWINNSRANTTYDLEQNTGVNNTKAISINSISYQDAKWSKTITLDTDKSYRLTAKAKLENVISQVDLGAYVKADGVISSKTDSTGSSDYKEIYVDFKVPKGTELTKNVVIDLGLGDTNNLAKGKVTFDDIKILENDQIIEEPTKKLLATVDFEAGENANSNFGGGATYTIENSGGVNNSKCLSISSASNVDAAWYRYVPTVPGKYYKITAKVKTENIQGKAFIAFDGKYNYIENTNGQWQTLSFISQAKEQNGFVFCNLGGYYTVASGKAYFDDITVEEYQDIAVYDDFEAQNNSWINDNTSGVKYTVENNAGVNNSRCLSISAEDYALGKWTQIFKLTPGKYYRVFANVKVENVVSKGSLGGVIGTTDSICSEGYQSTLSGGWKKKELAFLVKEEENGETPIELNLGYWTWEQKAKGKVYFDNLVIVEDTNMAINTSKHFKTIFEKSDVANISSENLNAWLGKLDAAYEKMAEFAGTAPHNGKYLTLSSIKGGETVGGLYVIGGTPYIFWPQAYIKETLKNINVGDTSFGVLHEIGHQFSLGNGSWEWINDEMFANFRKYYAVEELNLKIMTGGKTYNGAELMNFYKTDGGGSYDKTIGNTTNPKFSQDALMWKLLSIKNTIGWQPFKDTFKELSSKQSIKTTNFDKFQEFINVLDSKTSYDVRAMFTNSEWSVIQNGMN